MADENGKTVEEWGEELEGHRDAERWEALLESAEGLIEEHPNDPLGYFSRAISNHKLKRNDRALKDQKKKTAINFSLQELQDIDVRSYD